MRWRSESGHSLPEYAILVAGIAVVCVFAVLVLGAGIREHVGSGGPDTSPPAPLTPPSHQPSPTFPTSLADCAHGGWRDFPQFRNQRECEQYVRRFTR